MSTSADVARLRPAAAPALSRADDFDDAAAAAVVVAVVLDARRRANATTLR